MKEYTIITTAEITTIIKLENVTADEWNRVFTKAVKERLDADDVTVKNVKLFPREIE